MKKLFLLGGVAAAMVGLSSCGSGDAPKTFEDSVAYFTAQASGQGLVRNINGLPEEMRDKVNKDAFLRGLQLVMEADTASFNDFMSGVQFGAQQVSGFMQMHDAGIDVNRQLFMKEFAKAFKADTVGDLEMMKVNETLTPLQERLMNVLMRAQQKKMEEQQKAITEKFEKNKAAGAKFIAEKTAADKGIKVTESGLAYKVTKMGTGAVAKDTDRVKVKYTGKLIDGTEFDSSKGQEATFSPKSVVPGFGEALTLLPAGTVVTLYIPENLGYGRQASGKIEPGSTLVFDIEIGEIVSDSPVVAAAADSTKTK